MALKKAVFVTLYRHHSALFNGPLLPSGSVTKSLLVEPRPKAHDLQGKQMRLRSLVLTLTVLTACDAPAPEDSGSICPSATDSCMNEENHQDCLDVEATCDGPVVVMESCPLQFGCES
jgi:hypothetical protein